jgi:hypothetical protein
LGEYAIAPLSNQDYVFQDLSATRYFADTKDKIACEPKSKTVGRLKRSPDSEAVIIALENGMGLMVQPTHQTQVVEDDDMAVFRRWERCREPGSIEALKREFTV